MSILLLYLVATSSVAADFIGPFYPYPRDLSSEKSLVAASWKNVVTAELDAYLGEGVQVASLANVGMENLTFSAGLFSLSDPEVESLQYFYTAPEVANATNGTNHVDADCIYGMASITKLFTVFAGMVSLSEDEWNRPLSQVFPELAQPAGDRDKTVNRPNFDEITAWSLATHMSGLPYWMLPNYDHLTTFNITPELEVTSPVEFGFPALDLDSLGPCWGPTTDIFCPPNKFLSVVASQYPQFTSWSSPSYSNGGLFLLGMAIGAMKNTTLEKIWQDSVFNPLNMTSTSAHPSNDPDKVARGVMGAVPEAWTLNLSYTIGSGGLKSSLADLNKFSVALLNSTLLPPALTRKWMAPTALSPSHSYAVGGPWEIMRYSHPITGRITDLYTKSGDAGPHGGIIALIPEYNAGFNILCQAKDSATRTLPMLTLIDHVALNLLPALEAQAAAEAAANYVGVYRAADINSSMTVAFDASADSGAVGGLSVTSWISNGTEMLTNPWMEFDGMIPKLLPTIIDAQGSGEVAFYATVNRQTTSYQAAGKGPWVGWYESNLDWAGLSRTAYGGISVREVVFDVDEQGRATRVRPLAFRVDLDRVE